MSHYKFSIMMLPLLSLLAISPSDIAKNFPSRSLASVEEQQPAEKIREAMAKRNPLYRKYVLTLDVSNVGPVEFANQAELFASLLNARRDVEKSHEDFNKEEASQADVEVLKLKIREYVISSLAMEDAIKDLKEKNLATAEERSLDSITLNEVKAGIEVLLQDVKDRELALNPVAPSVAPSVAEQPAAPQAEVAPASVKPAPSQVRVEPKNENKEDKEEKVAEAKADEANCPVAAQVLALTQQNQQLMAQMQNMMNMMQMNMYSQRQMNLYPQMPGAFQHSSMPTHGSWVYRPAYQMPQNDYFGLNLPSALPQVEPQVQQPQSFINQNWTSSPVNPALMFATSYDMGGQQNVAPMQLQAPSMISQAPVQAGPQQPALPFRGII